MWFLLFLLTLPFIQVYVQSEAVLVDLEGGKNGFVPSGINLALSFYSIFPLEAQHVSEMPSLLHLYIQVTYTQSLVVTHALKLYVEFLCIYARGCTYK